MAPHVASPTSHRRMSVTRIHAYEITRPVERSGPGSEYLARVVEGGAPVPVGTELRLCVVGENEAGGDGVLRELLHAHGLARGLTGAGVSAPLDFGIDGEAPLRRFWWVSPLVSGRTLEALLRDVGALPDPLTEAVAVALAAAVRDIHAAGLHGLAIDPSRVLLRDDSSVVLVDVGLGPVIAQRARSADATDADRRAVAPELIEPDPRPSARADLYSVGSLLYRCAAGEWYQRQPSDEQPSRRPSDARPGTSAFLSEVVHELLEPDVDCRIASAAELVEILALRRESEWWRARRIVQAPLDEVSVDMPTPEPDPEPPPIPPPAPMPEPEWFEERRSHGVGLAPHDAPCIGREEELGALLAHVRALREEGGGVVLVEGAAGVGKTRILDALLERARRIPGLVVLHGEHRSRGIGRPMQAFSEALTRWVAGDRREVTANDVVPLLGDATAIATAFAAFLSSSPLPDGEERLRRESLASAFLQCLRTLTRVGPVVFVVENLQWADPEGLDLFGHLARACDTLPLLLIGSHRPAPERSQLSALVASLSVLPRHARHEIAPLTPDGAHDVARALVRPRATADALVAALDAELRLNPLGLVEAARLLVARGTLRCMPGGGFEDATGGEGAAPAIGALPATLDELVGARLDSLPAQHRAALEMASVQGLVFDADVVARALAGEVLPTDFEALAAGQFLCGEQPVWRFTSNALLGRLHDTLDDEDLQQRHEATADAFLACRNPDHLPPSEIHGILSYRIAWHYLLAGREARGLLYVAAALVHLRDTWRIGDAERLADLACRALARAQGRKAELIDLLVERSDLLGLQGRRVEQREVLDEALLRARDYGDIVREARAILESARLRLLTGQIKRARHEAREALRQADEGGDVRLEARCLRLLGTVAFREGRYQEARTHMQRVLELSRRIRDEEAEAEALQALGTISQGVGSWDHAEELQRLAMGIYRRSGDLASEAEVLASLGAIASATDDPVKAEQYLRRTLAIHRSLGDGYGEARALGQLGLLMQDSMRLAEARALHRAACRASREVGARPEELAALLNLATTEFVLGRTEEARDHYGDALRAAREIGDARLEGYALTGLGEVARVRGEITIAAGLLERAVRALDGSNDVGGQAAAFLASGRVAALAADTEEAAQLLQRAVELSRAASTPSVTAVALSLLGLLAARRGDADASSVQLAEARQEVDELPGAILAQIEVVFVESLVARVRRDPRLADRLLLEAEGILHRFAGTLREEDRTRFCASASPAREIVAGAAALRASRAATPIRSGDTA